VNLTSAPLPPLTSADHVKGNGPLLFLYADFECPFCAVLHARLRGRDARVVFRHFPVRSKHPRAWAAACAAEAAALQGAFWEFHDALFADQGRIEDPHLWARAERLDLDLDRFEVDRRSEAIAEHVRADFAGGIRAGIVTTPTVVVGGQQFAGAEAVRAVELAVHRDDRRRTTDDRV
jgi:protein-disulfide isomerase